MDANEIVEALSLLNAELRKRQAVGELCLFGGAVMVLVFRERNSTKDIDAIFHPSDTIRVCAEAVAQELGLPNDWLNDGVKGFIETQPPLGQHPNLPQYDHLKLLAPTPEYLLAMKCLASRIGAGQTDYADAKTLVRHLGYQTPEQVMALIEEYYPVAQIPIRARYFIEELFPEAASSTVQPPI